MGFERFDERNVVMPLAEITNALGTNWVSLYAASGIGGRLDSIWISSTSVSNAVVDLAVYSGAGNRYNIAAIAVPAGAGHGVVPAVQVLPAALPSSMDGLVIPGTYSVWVKAEVGVAAGEVISVAGQGGSF